MIKNASKLDLTSGSLLVPGRCRLAAIQVAATDVDADRPKITDFDFDAMKVELSNGSGGDVLFGLCIPLPAVYSYTSMPFYYHFGNARILFTDGIYSMSVSASVAPMPDEMMISVFYEGA